jgi:hypothetical protein
MTKTGWYERWVAEGKCANCGGVKDRLVKTCTKCASRQKEWMDRHPGYSLGYDQTKGRARRARWKAEGRCVRCGKPAAEGRSQCSVCSGGKRRRHPYQKYREACRICGFEFSDVHHIDGNHKNNDPPNLISLCPNHHRLVHLGKLVLDEYLVQR